MLTFIQRLFCCSIWVVCKLLNLLWDVKSFARRTSPEWLQDIQAVCTGFGDSLGLGYRFWQTLVYLLFLFILTVQLDSMNLWLMLCLKYDIVKLFFRVGAEAVLMLFGHKDSNETLIQTGNWLADVPKHSTVCLKVQLEVWAEPYCPYNSFHGCLIWFHGVFIHEPNCMVDTG